MQHIPTQSGKSYSFESSDSETDLGIMKSKVNSSYNLNVTKQHLFKRSGVKELISSLHIPLKRIISQCDSFHSNIFF